MLVAVVLKVDCTGDILDEALSGSDLLGCCSKKRHPWDPLQETLRAGASRPPVWPLFARQMAFGWIAS